jgi:hypothetical protein
MPIYTMSIDKVNELDEEHAKIVSEIDIITNKDINTMWIEELDELLHYYKKNNL